MRRDRAWARAIVLTGFAALVAVGVWSQPCWAEPPAAEKKEQAEAKSDADAVEEVVASFKDEDSKDLVGLASGLARRLTVAGKAGSPEYAKAEAEATKLAAEVLKAKGEFTTDKAFIKLLDRAAKKNAPVAARWLLQFARAWRAAEGTDTPRHVVAGQVSAEGGKLDPVLILAPMQILDGGYFACETGDVKKPLGFRAYGYSNLDVSLEGKSGEVICLPSLKLKALPKKQQATLKGKITADGSPDMKKVNAKLSMPTPMLVTPKRSYYYPRPRWPEPVKVTIDDQGEFTATGLTPNTYTFTISAEGYGDFSKTVTFKAGETQDAGECHLVSTDIGFYVGAKAPEAKELSWEKDYDLGEGLRRRPGEGRKREEADHGHEHRNVVRMVQGAGEQGVHRCVDPALHVAIHRGQGLRGEEADAGMGRDRLPDTGLHRQFGQDEV
jgi:hypothetical protein